MDRQHELIEQRNKGRTATILSDAINPDLQRLENDALSELKGIYRSGQHKLEAYMGVAARLIVVEDLRAKFNQTINSGVAAAEEIETTQREGDHS